MAVSRRRRTSALLLAGGALGAALGALALFVAGSGDGAGPALVGSPPALAATAPSSTPEAERVRRPAALDLAPAQESAALGAELAAGAAGDELERAAAPSGREAEFLARYRDLGRREPAALDARAAEISAGAPAELAERVALLRALWELRGDAARAPFEHALLAVSASSSDDVEVVRAFAVRFLGERCATDARAQAWLEHALWPGGAHALPPELRRRAALLLGAGLRSADLDRSAAHLADEEDRSVIEALLAGAAQGELAGDEGFAELCRVHATVPATTREGDVP